MQLLETNDGQERSTHASISTCKCVPVGFEEKCQLVTVELILRVDHIHREQTLTHFALAHFKHLVLLFTLQIHKDNRLVSRLHSTQASQKCKTAYLFAQYFTFTLVCHTNNLLRRKVMALAAPHRLLSWAPGLITGANLGDVCGALHDPANILPTVCLHLLYTKHFVR